jgi:hydroxymethylbilane synthase
MNKQTDKVTPLILGSRGSDLAITQVRQVDDCLRRAGHQKIEIRIIHSVGDKRPDLKLSQFSDPGATGGEAILDKGIFTKELEDALLAREIHAAVHSLKDVPTELNDALVISATLERAPIEDVLLSRNAERPYSIDSLPRNGVVATSSVRRARQLGWLRPDLNIVDIRGNVPTRIHKLVETTEWDAIMLARAGLQRLGFLESTGQSGSLNFEASAPVGFCILDAAEFLPAAGQGAVGIESRRSDQETNSALASINHQPTFARTSAERAFLALLQAGCQTPVGLYTWWQDGGTTLNMKTRIFDEEDLEAAPREGEVSAPATGLPGDLAEQLMGEVYGD